MNRIDFMTCIRRAAWIAMMMAFVRTLAARADDALSQDVFPGARRASGVVFLDSNGNGKQDAAEEGLEGVRLLAGWRIATTDENGRYIIESEKPFYNVSVCVPLGKWLPPNPGAWFRRMEYDRERNVDFGLLEDAQALPFLFVQVTDDHGDHPRTFPVVLEECEKLPLKPKFYVCTGDMRAGYPLARNNNDASNQKIGANFSKFSRPLFMVPGNHDTTGWCHNKTEEMATQQQRKHPRFLHGGWERYVCPANWSFSYGGVHFLGVGYNLCNTQADGTRICTPGIERIEAWIIRQLDNRPVGGSRTVLFCHEPGMGAALVEKFQLTSAFVGAHHQVGRNAGGGGLHPKNVLVAGKCSWPFKDGGTDGETNLTIDGYPQGYAIHVVEKDRIDTFYRPLLIPEEHVIMVYEPDRRRVAKMRLPAEVEVWGQVLDLEGKAGRVMVRLGDQQVEAKTARRRFWVDFRTAVMLQKLEDVDNTLTVTVDFPDGKYAVRPGPERDWKVRKLK